VTTERVWDNTCALVSKQQPKDRRQPARVCELTRRNPSFTDSDVPSLGQPYGSVVAVRPRPSLPTGAPERHCGGRGNR
jgi:hypothetical protein